jgi:hypothetical protein
MSKPYRMNVSSWNVERIMFAIAGILITVFALLAILSYPAFVWGDAFVGGMLVFFAVTGYCPMAMIVSGILNRKKAS